MFKTNLARIVQRLFILSALLVCLGMTANVTAPASVQAAAAAACPRYMEEACVSNGGDFNYFHCTCSYFEDVYACQQAGGTWNYHIAECEF